jgi:hypothetical protein
LKKHLLLDIKCIVTKENNGKDVISNTAVLLKDLANSQDHIMPLEKFDQEVRLLDLGSTSNIKLSKNNKIDAIKIENSVDHLEFYIIQINSHFGKTQQDWRKVTDNIVINFITQRTSQDPTSITDNVMLPNIRAVF